MVGAFSRASDAVAAALDVQRAFARGAVARGWRKCAFAWRCTPARFDLRDAGNYFGPTIIRCARMRAIGHGGQTLISDATRDLVVDALPEAAELRDLGLHRLKDLGRAERIWQLVHPDLGHEFPPLRSLGAMPTNLPAQVSSFVGRDAEIAEVRAGRAREPVGDADRYRRVWQDSPRVARGGRRARASPDGVWCAELAAVARRPRHLPGDRRCVRPARGVRAAAHRHADRTAARSRRAAGGRQLRTGTRCGGAR